MGDSNVNCNGATATSGSVMPAQQVSYHVRGATFTLQLPDGRAAVVNCESKFKERIPGLRAIGGVAVYRSWTKFKLSLGEIVQSWSGW